MRHLLLALIALPLFAQHTAYAPMQQREIKALSDDQIRGYLQGDGMGLALPAELNGYPGPKHVLDLADQLDVTPEQREAVQAIFDRMNKHARDLGARIVEAERALEKAFRNGAIDAGSLQAQTGAIAKLQGELRAAHLLAHLETKVLLTPAQFAAYSRLRGYEAGTSHSHHH